MDAFDPNALARGIIEDHLRDVDRQRLTRELRRARPRPVPGDTRSASSAPVSEQLRLALSDELLRLAADEADVAVREAERVHYWEPTPFSVVVHRQCAVALRAAADELRVPGHPQLSPG